MPRTTIAAVLAMLLFLAPAASARPADVGYPAYPTPEVAAKPMIQSERITDHSVVPTAEEIKQALAQEKAYSHTGNADVGGVGALVREQESTSGSGNQGLPRAASPANVPAPSDDDAPWLIIALGIAAAALGVGALAVVHRNRTRSSVAV